MQDTQKDYTIRTSSLFGILTMVYITTQIIFQQGSNVDYSNYFNLFVGVVFVVTSVINKDYSVYWNGFLKAYGAFVLFCFASYFWALDQDSAYATNMTIIKVWINNILLYTIIKRYKVLDWMMAGIIVGAIVNYMILAGIYLPEYEIQYGLRFNGTFPNSNTLAIAMIHSIFISAIFFQKTKKRWIQFLLGTNMALSVYVAFLTGSRKGVVISVLALSFFIATQISKPRKIIITAFLLGALAYVFYDSLFSEGQIERLEYAVDRTDRMVQVFGGDLDAEDSANRRVEYMALGLDLFFEHPLTGIGINSFRYYTTTYSHNNHTELLADVGLIGFLLYYLGYFLIILGYYRSRNKASKIIPFVALLFILIIEFGFVSYYEKIILLMVMMLSAALEEKTDDEPGTENKTAQQAT